TNHARLLRRDVLEYANARGIHQRVRPLKVGPISIRERSENAVVKARDPLASVFHRAEVGQKLAITVRRRNAVLQRHTQLMRTFAERVGMLRQIPDMRAKEKLDLHLRRGRHPGGDRLHQPDVNPSKRRGAFAAFPYAQHISVTVLATSSAVSSG